MDLLLHMMRFWRSILLASVLSALAGFFGSQLLPSRWEATAVIRIGNLLDERIEPVAGVIERLHGAYLVQKVAARLGMTEVGADRLRDIRVRELGDDLQMRVRAGSAQEAARILTEFFGELQVEHDALMQEKLAELRQTFAALEKVSAAPGAGSEAGSDASVGRDALLKLEASTLPPQTSRTFLLQPVSVWPRPVSPDPIRFAALAAVLGLMLGMARAVHAFGEARGRA